MKRLFFITLLISTFPSIAQNVAIEPVFSPEELNVEEEITITYDVTGTALEDLPDAWIWMWLSGPEIDAPSNINPASSNSSATDVAKFTREVVDGKVLFSISLILTEFLAQPASAIDKVGIILKGDDWSAGQTTDYFFQVGSSNTPPTAGTFEILPSISPFFPKADEEVTITFDVTDTPLEGLEEAWLWLWLRNTTGDIDAPTNINPASTDPSATSGAKFSKGIVDGKTIFSISLILTDFTGQPASEIGKIGIILKGNDFADGQTSDFLFEIVDGFALQVTSPAKLRAYYQPGDMINVEAVTSEAANITILIDGIIASQVAGSTSLEYTHLAIDDGQPHSLEVEAASGNEIKRFLHSYVTNPVSSIEVIPTGLRDGINYSTDLTRATLVLTAPGKESVFVIGSFNDWIIDTDHMMKKDGDRFWLEITDLEAGIEYLYQYLIDGELEVSDPYSEKVSSSFDDAQVIAENRYPELVPFPSEMTGFEATYLRTGRDSYPWEIESFQKPDKEDLVIYELLVRDFSVQRTFQAVMDRLDYLDSLGINAIELMPVTEFEGNISWGYNPSYKLAVDKFYGTEDELKKLIDEAHKRGMAVILDMVLNHQYGRSPLIRMEAEGDFGPPSADNVWFNPDFVPFTPEYDARHPFNVGYDFNHESTYTQDYVDRVVKYWIEEYKVDGYRFDLSKGFTQKNSFEDAGAMAEYDQSRVDILKRMADVIWSVDPQAYVILEHFADNTEERELANYGMMLWGNVGGTFKELAGRTHDTPVPNMDWLYHDSRNWTEPNVVGYMESHDEERILFEIRDTPGSLKIKLNKLQQNAAFFLMVPGPKMIWQFGEFGYDVELNNDRLGIKPTKWEYLDDPDRRRLFDVYQSMINLKTGTDLVDDQYFSWNPDGAIKWINYDHPDVKISIFGNFGLGQNTGDPHFVNTGEWYDYFTGEMITVTDPNAEVELQPGEFHVYTSEFMDNFIENDPIDFVLGSSTGHISELYPNPTSDFIRFHWKEDLTSYRISDISGRLVMEGELSFSREVQIEITNLLKGVYLLELSTSDGNSIKQKFIKE